MNNKEYYFIYNFEQAKFMANAGCIIDDIGTGTKGDFFIKFKKCELVNDIIRRWKNHENI